MSYFCNVFVNTYSTVMLAIIWSYSRFYGDRESKHGKYFGHMLVLNILMLTLDTFARTDVHTDNFLFYVKYMATFLLYLLGPAIPSVWVLYVYHYTGQPSNKILRTRIIIDAINATNAFLTILTPFFGLYYYVDAEHMYHQGILFPIANLLSFVLLLTAVILAEKRHISIGRNQYLAIWSFILIPLLCLIFQTIIPEFSLINNGFALSLLVLFLYVQIQDIFTDFLTGIANRKKLDIYLRKKQLACTPEKTFSAIMLDLNNFKNINDTLGHMAGDIALQSTASILQKCLSKNDMLARYGGDEFCIVLDTSDPAMLEQVVAKIRYALDDYNKQNDLPYTLEVSMGYAIYRYGMSIYEFQDEIDRLMYKNKPVAQPKYTTNTPTA